MELDEKSFLDIPEEWVPTSTQRLLSGSFGGVCSVSATHPLDTIRVRLQMGMGLPTLNIRSLYRGVLPPVIGVAPISAICFGGYDFGLKTLKRQNYTFSNFQLNFLAGMFAALPTSILAVPGERIKIMQQVHGNNSLPIITIVKNIYGEYGIKGLYRGMAITLMRDIPACGVWFSSYEAFKIMLNNSFNQGSSTPSVPVIMLSGALAGLSQWTVSLPLDTIKTRVQSHNSHITIGNVLSDLIREGRVKGSILKVFYRGYIPSIMRSIPGNAIGWLGTESALYFFKTSRSG